MSVDMNIKLKTLLDITGDFSKKHEVVGRTEKSGRSHGQVYKGLYKDEKIAMKRIDPEMIELDDKKIEKELLILGEVKHENVVKLVGFCRGLKSHFIEEGGREFWKPLMERILCFEFMPGGSLHDHIAADSRDLDWPTCYKIIKGTCEGINRLLTTSRNSIFFLNIKPSNILLDNNNNAKVDGLNLSRFVSTKTIEGTQRQEFGNSGHTSSEYDVKSLGDLILKLMDGNSWFERYCEMSNEEFADHVHKKWKKKSMEKGGYQLQETDRLQVNKCVVLALNCVQNDRDKRPSMKLIVDELKLDQVPSHLCFPEKLPTSGPRRKQHVVILYAFDCSISTTAWCTVDRIFWMVQESLSHYINSSLGYIYLMMEGNTYTKDMKLVDPEENKATGYKKSPEWGRKTCTKNMQSGLKEAQELISHRGNLNGVILLFSDGLMHKEEDFFDGAEEFESKVPVHTFTLGGDKYNEGLRAIAKNSPGGKFHRKHVPERPTLSARFSRILDNIIDGTTFEDEESPSPSSETQQRLDVVLVYAFDCTNSTPTWDKMDHSIFWMVQERLTRLEDSCMGYIYPMLTKNNYTSDMKVVYRADSKDGGYTAFDWRRLPCTKNMASGLKEANKMLRNRDNKNGIILFFSDGLINKGDFFDGTETTISEFPVHTFTLGGDAYNKDLKAIAKKSPGGNFHDIPVPDRPEESVHFKEILDSLLLGTKTN